MEVDGGDEWPSVSIVTAHKLTDTRLGSQPTGDDDDDDG